MLIEGYECVRACCRRCTKPDENGEMGADEGCSVQLDAASRLYNDKTTIVSSTKEPAMHTSMTRTADFYL